MIHLPCLTIKQPWAALIAAGFKTVENRSYAPPKTIRGKRIGIHAGMAWDESTDKDYYLNSFWITADINPFDPVIGNTKRRMNSHGCILATAEITGWYRSVDGCDLIGFNDGTEIKLSGPGSLPEWKWWDRSCFGWVLRDVHLLPTPIPARGQQGIWYIDVEEEAALNG